MLRKPHILREMTNKAKLAGSAGALARIERAARNDNPTRIVTDTLKLKVSKLSNRGGSFFTLTTFHPDNFSRFALSAGEGARGPSNQLSVEILATAIRFRSSEKIVRLTQLV